MNDPEKAPLPLIVYEEIAQSWHKIDQEHWPKIAKFRRPNFVPPSQPVAPRVPGLLLKQIREYATELFKAEADQYHRLAGNIYFRAWLSNLEARVLRRVVTVVKELHEADPKEMLMVHGLEYPSMVESLREMLWELGNTWNASPKHVAQSPDKEPQISPPSSALADSRARLRDAYRAVFPGAGIFDICWAAEQHYREWVRWLKGELKDGSKPDRCFRHVLTGEKDARTIRKVQRPKGWK